MIFNIGAVDKLLFSVLKENKNHPEKFVQNYA